MTTIITRVGKGSPLTFTEMDTNLTNLNTDKQENLVSGTTIKTINSTSLLGAGDVAVQPTLVSGTNIKTVGGVSLLGSGDVTVGSGDVVGQSSSVDSEIALFSGVGGKTIKRATGSGIAKITSGVLGTAVSGTDLKTVGGTSIIGSGDIAVSSGALVYLSTVTASNSATVDVEWTNGTYDVLMLVLSDVTLTAAGVPKVQMKLNGSYDTGGNYVKAVFANTSTSGTVSGSAGEGLDGIALTTGNVGIDSGGSCNLTFYIRKPDGTTHQKQITWSGSYSPTTTVAANVVGSGANTATTALTGLRFSNPNGNVNSGSFRLYGISNS